MLIDQLATNAHVGQAQARQARYVLAFVVHPRRSNVDDFDLASFQRLGLETVPHRPAGAGFELSLNNLQPFVDLLLIGTGAIPTEHELDDVGGYWELPTEGANQVFPDQIPSSAGAAFLSR